MKTTADVLSYIEDFMANINDRPDMYAANPESLEGQLSLLDDMRKRLLMPNADEFALRDLGYTAFLKSRSYGVASYCHRQREAATLLDDRQLFLNLADFWNQYMQSGYFARP
jgi:hypothetical protein